jgi:hypothetical protein
MRERVEEGEAGEVEGALLSIEEDHKTTRIKQQAELPVFWWNFRGILGEYLSRSSRVRAPSSGVAFELTSIHLALSTLL